MKKYVCDVCGYVYDPAVGDPDNGIAAGTAFEDIPDSWVCPLCGVGKDQFSEEAEGAQKPRHERTIRQAPRDMELPEGLPFYTIDKCW